MACSSQSYNEYEPVYTKSEEWRNTGTPDGEVMVFYPNMEELADFYKYIQFIESKNAHLSSGICKIVPPSNWRPRPSKPPGDYSDIDDFVIECPVRERIEGVSNGCYVKNNIVYRKEMRVRDFRKLALSKHMRTPKPDYNLLELERHFWRNLLHHEPIYGADTPGSLYEPSIDEFNMNRLGTILDLLKEQQVTIKGVNTVFLYFGMWKTMFPWHVEDMDLYSINYLHFGEPKFWYSIPSQSAEKFERLAAQRFPDGLQICKAFLRHKLYILSPSVLKAHGIPYGTMVQYPGEFIITFPKGYHMGFNTGYNCAESTNFALERWIDYGKTALLCFCRKDTVEIDMRPFMQKYRPNEYKQWFDYWYGERPSACKAKKQSNEENRRKNSIIEEAQCETSSEEGFPNSTSICTKRQKKIFKARKPMKNLWANQPVNLFAEKEHNIRSGKLYPHCAVCQYFVARETWQKNLPVDNLPESSRQYVTDQMFQKEQKLENIDWTIKEEKLLECSNCRVVVHRNCYPSGEVANASTNVTGNRKYEVNEDIATSTNSLANTSNTWLCERCFGRHDNQIRSASCKLCELRGGALIETRDSSGMGFVHVICAIMDRGTRFLQPRDRRAPISPPPRKLIAQLSPESTGSHLPGSSPTTSHRSHGFSSSPEQTSPFVNGINSHIQNAMTQHQLDSPLVNIGYRISDIPLIPERSRDSFAHKCNSSKLDNSISNTQHDETEITITTTDSFTSLTNDHDSLMRIQNAEYPSNYQCEVCGHQSESLIRCRICVEMDELGAKLRFHTTCANLADITFERRHFPDGAIPVCSFHHSDQGALEDPALMDPRYFQLGQRIIVHEPEDGIIGYGKILSITEHLYATVDFLDGSVSSSIFPCDIPDCECRWFGCVGGAHIPGSLVYVNWSDGEKYQAYYRGKSPTKKFKIKLFPPVCLERPDSEIIELAAENIYRRDDALPEEVRHYLMKRSSSEALE